MDEEETVLEIGDILVHHEITEIGLLLRRFDVLDDAQWPLWAWDILWVGSEAEEIGRRQAFTEEGLIGLIESGVFRLHKST